MKMLVLIQSFESRNDGNMFFTSSLICIFIFWVCTIMVITHLEKISFIFMVISMQVGGIFPNFIFFLTNILSINL